MFATSDVRYLSQSDLIESYTNESNVQLSYISHMPTLTLVEFPYKVRLQYITTNLTSVAGGGPACQRQTRL